MPSTEFAIIAMQNITQEYTTDNGMTATVNGPGGTFRIDKESLWYREDTKVFLAINERQMKRLTLVGPASESEVFEGTHKQEIRREFTRKKTAKHTVLDREIEHWEKKESTKRVFRLEVGDMVLFNTAAVHRPIYHRRDSGPLKWGRLHLLLSLQQ